VPLKKRRPSFLRQADNERLAAEEADNERPAAEEPEAEGLSAEAADAKRNLPWTGFHQ